MLCYAKFPWGAKGSCFEIKSVEIDHFTVVCLVTWPINESEARAYLVLVETSLLFLC